MLVLAQTSPALKTLRDSTPAPISLHSLSGKTWKKFLPISVSVWKDNPSSKNDDFGKWSIQKLYRAAIHKHTSIYNDHRSRCFQRLHGIDIGNMECTLVFGLYIISLQCQPEYRLIHFRRGGRTDSRFPLPGIGSDRRNNIARRRDLYRGGGFLRLFGRDSGEPRKLTDKYRQQSLLRLWTIHSLYSHESDEEQRLSGIVSG